jgi:hypothetical protein
VRDHNLILGDCFLIPTHGVVLVMADERNCESSFRFFQLPAAIPYFHGAVLVATSARPLVASRFRRLPRPAPPCIVERFAIAGYLELEKDDLA